jgi:parvulin-like peptidyl-prolyl isomerase
MGAMALLLCLTTPLVAQAQSDPNAVFATVNGEEIKSINFWHRLAWYHFDPSSPLSQLPAGFLTINQLITEKLVFQMGHDKGIALTDEEIAAEVKSREDADPSILADLKGSGRPESDLYEEVKYDLMQYKLKTFGITITDQEVEKHYHDYPTDYTTPKQFKLKVIVVSTDGDAAAVDKDLAAGKSFADVAIAHSQDLSASKGGDFGVVSDTQLAPTALQTLNSTKIGEVTGWVTAPNSPVRLRYQIQDIYPSKLQPLDATLKEQIRRRMSLDKGVVKNQVMADLNSATLSAKVVINQAGFQKLYDQMISSYRRAHPVSSGN